MDRCLARKSLASSRASKAWYRAILPKLRLPGPILLEKMAALAFDTYVPVPYTRCQRLFFIDLYDNNY